MFQMAEGLVSGGWNALNNVVAGIGKGASGLVGGFFPTAQRETIKSETVMAAGGTGQTYRPTAPDAPSINESWLMAEKGWIGTPYEMQYAIPSKIAESKKMEKIVSTARGDPIGQGLDWALQQTKKITTVYDELRGLWEPREVISETPRAGTAEGRDVRHLNETIARGAEIVKTGAAYASQIYDQVKGLFSTGYPQQAGQPAFSIQHELQPTAKTTIGLAIAAAIIILLIFLGRKK